MGATSKKWSLWITKDNLPDWLPYAGAAGVAHHCIFQYLMGGKDSTTDVFDTGHQQQESDHIRPEGIIDSPIISP
jgi:hypothetical protein